MSPTENETRTRRVRQQEIAARCGVSISTVSRVLNGVGGISTPVRASILAAAAALGYAAPLLGSPVQHVGFFVTFPPTAQAAGPFYGDILDSVEAACRQRGIHLSYTVVDRHTNATAFVLDKIAQNRIDAALFLAIDDLSLYEAVRAAQVPSVLLNAEHPRRAMDAFLPDNRTGATLATQHLIAYGHQRICVVTNFHRQTFFDRLDAHRAVLTDAGIPFDPALIVETSLDTQAAYEAMRARLARGAPDFTALFCMNDICAIGVLRAVREAGLRVPDDLSMIGFDDIPMVAYTDPPLTTIRVARQELGLLGLQRLLDRAATPDLTPIRVEVACQLIERQSVAAVRRETAPHH